MLREQRDSSWAKLPLRTPPPGWYEDAMLRTPIRMPGLDDTRATAASKVSDCMTLILGNVGVSDGKGCEACEVWTFFAGSKPGV